MGTVLTGTAVFEIVAWTDADEATRRRVLTRNGSRDRLTGASTLATSIQELLEDVRARGDAALVDALSRFDKVDCDMDQLRVSDEEFAAARAILPGPVHEAIQLAIERSTTFNREIVERASWSVESGTATLGEIARPIESTGLFVPSGKGSFRRCWSRSAHQPSSPGYPGSSSSFRRTRPAPAESTLPPWWRPMSSGCVTSSGSTAPPASARWLWVPSGSPGWARSLVPVARR